MTEPVIPTLAATILLVRQRAEMEVLMAVRGKDARFASAMVFPGGGVDEADSAPLWDDFARGAAGLSAEARALRVAAFRELHEEAGVLLGDRAEKPLPAGAGNVFADALAAHGAQLDLDALVPFAHWITPAFAPKRFNTHFFLCGLETDVTPFEDGGETVSVEWIAPQRALDLSERGERTVVFATRANLTLLAQTKTVDEAIMAAKARKLVTVTPTREKDEKGAYLAVPEHAGYGRFIERIATGATGVERVSKGAPPQN